MYEYKNLSRLTKAAIIVVFTYLLLDVVASTAVLIEGPLPPDEVGVGGFLALLELVGLIVCVWIGRASCRERVYVLV